MSVSPDKIKKTITSRLRRNNKALARRVKLIDEAFFLTIPSEKPNPIEDDRSGLLISARHAKRKHAYVSKILNIDSLNSPPFKTSDLRCRMESAAKMAQALLMSAPNGTGDPQADTAKLFSLMQQDIDIHIDAIPNLLRQAFDLIKQDSHGYSESTLWLSRAQKCFELVVSAVDEFSDELRADPNIKYYYAPHCSITMVSDEYLSLLPAEMIASLNTIELQDNSLVINSRFSNGSSPIVWGKLTADASSNTWSILNEGYGNSLHFPGLTDSNGTSLLNNSALTNMNSPIQKVVNEISNAIGNEPQKRKLLALELEDLNDYMDLQRECRVHHINRAAMQFPATLKLNKTSTVTIRHDEQIKHVDVATALALSEGRHVNVIVDLKESRLLKISSTSLSQVVKSNYKAVLSINQNGSDTLFDIGIISNSSLRNANTTPFPSPERNKNRQHAITLAKAIHESKGRYINRLYTDAELKDMTASYLDKNLLPDAQNILQTTINTLNKSALASFSFVSDVGNDMPCFYVNLNLYSFSGGKMRTRDVSVFISETKDGPIRISDSCSSSTGIDSDTLASIGVSALEADSLLFKALTNANTDKSGLALMTQSIGKMNDILSRHFPRVAELVKDSPVIDKQTISKQLSLAHSNADVLSIYTQKNRSKKIDFSDTFGSAVGPRALLKAGVNGQLVSDDGLSTMILHEDAIYIRDHGTSFTGYCCSAQHLKQRLHTHSIPKNFNNSRGDIGSLLKEYKVKALLNLSQPKVSITHINSIDISDIPMASPKLSKPNMEKVEALWTMCQRQYDFSLSPSKNVNSWRGMAANNFPDTSFDKVFAGGVGNLQGKAFLTALRESHPALFAATTYGCKTELAKLTNKKSNTKVSKETASVTVGDIMLANAFAFQMKNPRLTSHFQMHHHAKEMLSLFEPNTANIPVAGISQLAQERGVPNQPLIDIYKAAHANKGYDGRSTLSFIPSVNAIALQGESIVHDTVFLKSLIDNKHSIDAVIDILKQNMADNLIHRHVHQSIDSMNELDDRVIFSPSITSDHRSVVSMSLPAHKDGKISKTLQDEIGELSGYQYLVNGVYQSHPSSLLVSQTESEEIVNTLIKTLQSNNNIARLRRISNSLKSEGVTGLKSQKGKSFSVTWFKDALVSSASGSGKPTQLNTFLSHPELDSLHVFAKDILPKLSPLIDISPTATENFDRHIATAKQQYSCFTLTEKLYDSLESYPLLVNDPIVTKREYEHISSTAGVPTQSLTTNDALMMFNELAIKEKMPVELTEKLKLCIATGDKPHKGDIARVAYDFVVDRFRAPPPIIQFSDELKSFVNSMRHTSTNPIDTMIDNSQYRIFMSGNSLPLQIEPENDIKLRRENR